MMLTSVLLIFLSILKELNAELAPCYTDIYFQVKCNLDFNKIRIPANDSQLNKFCGNIENFYHCYRYYHLYYPKNLMCGWSMVLDWAEPVIKTVCTEEQTESNAEQAPCYTDFFFQYKCNLNFNEVRIPVNFSQLNNFCGNIKDFYKCYHYYHAKYPKDLMCGLSLVLEYAEPVINAVCTDEQTRYLKHARCMQKVEEYTHDCDKYSQAIYEIYLKMPHGLAEDKEEMRTCIIGNAKLGCLEEVLFRMCCLEAARFFKELVERSHLVYLFCKESQMLHSQYALRRVLDRLINIPFLEKYLVT